MSTAVVPLKNRGGSKRPIGTNPSGQTRQDAMNDLQGTVHAILGDVDVSKVTSVNLDAYESFAHIGRGLAVALSGRATVVQAQVAKHLIEYQDPLKLIMPPEVANDSRIVVKRKQVLGANAEIVPESAPARVVSVKEVEHEVVLHRYGGDIEMNTNLLAIPEEYAEDLNLKLSFQQNAMARRLSELGYEAVLNEAQNLPNLLIRSNPAMASRTSTDKAKQTVQLYAQQCFGALQKFQNAIPGLLAMAKKGSAAPFDVLVLPAGVPEMESFTSADAKFFLNGISDLDKRMSFGMDSVRLDPITGLKVGTYRGCVDYLDGQLSSQTIAGGLTREVTFVTMHDGNEEIVNLLTNTFDTCPGSSGKVTFRVVKAHVSSAVLGVSGSGASVVGYPTTSTFSQPTSPEKTMIQLRSYMGAYLTQPENVVVLPDVYFEGIESVGYVTSDANVTAVPTTLYMPGTGITSDYGTLTAASGSLSDRDALTELQALNDIASGSTPSDGFHISPMAFRGTAFDGSGKLVHRNKGHLGPLDAIDGAALFKGGFAMRPTVAGAAVALTTP